MAQTRIRFTGLCYCCGHFNVRTRMIDAADPLPTQDDHYDGDCEATNGGLEQCFAPITFFPHDDEEFDGMYGDHVDPRPANA